MDVDFTVRPNNHGSRDVRKPESINGPGLVSESEGLRTTLVPRRGNTEIT